MAMSAIDLFIEGRGQTNRDSQVITSGQLRDFSNVSETSSHHNGLVPEFLVVIEDLLNAFYARVFLRAVVLLIRGLVPVQDTANERRDEESTGLGCGNGLRKREHEGQIAVHLVLRLQDVGCLDTLPRRSQLDQDT